MTNTSDFSTGPVIHRLRLVATGFLLVQLIAGCGSTDSDEQIIPRTTDNVRLYQNGDYIEYDVTGTVTDTRFSRDSSGNNFVYPNENEGSCFPELVTPSPAKSFEGTLSVIWYTNPDLTMPPGGGGFPVNVIREESTLTISGDETGSWTSIRYISQNQNTGEITLRAFGDNVAANDYFWASTARTIDKANLSIITSPVILNSPVILTTDTSLDYFINSGCDGSQVCLEELRHYTGIQTFVGENPGGVTTYFGRIEPIGYAFRGDIEDTSTVRTTVTGLFDIRAFCSEGNKGIASFSGAAWILPELGVVKIENAACTDPWVTYVKPYSPLSTDTCYIDPTYDPNAAGPEATIVVEQRYWNWSAEIRNTNISLPQ